MFISFFQTASLNWRFWWVGWFGGGEASSGSQEMTSTTKAGGSGLRPATRRSVRSCRDLLPVYQEMELNVFWEFWLVMPFNF